MAKYFYVKEEIRKFSLPKSTSSYYVEDAYNGRVPSTLTIAFVAAESMSGKLQRNPFNFHHYKLSHLNISVSGSPIPVGPLSFDFEKGKYIQSYLNLYSGRITLKEFGSAIVYSSLT